MATLDLKTLSPNTRFTDMLFIVKEATILKKKNDDLEVWKWINKRNVFIRIKISSIVS